MDSSAVIGAEYSTAYFASDSALTDSRLIWKPNGLADNEISCLLFEVSSCTITHLRNHGLRSMTLIEQVEKDDFLAVLKRFKLTAEDFVLVETDTTDPQTDEIFALTGFVVVTQKSTNLKSQYPIGDGSQWVYEFERDLEMHSFGR
jgi:hypothetical protein